VDVHFPTSDGRELVFCRYTQPEQDHKIILAQLAWDLPPQSPPQITQKGHGYFIWEGVRKAGQGLCDK
jgi:hypothetical protein